MWTIVEVLSRFIDHSLQVGRMESEKSVHIRLSGGNILDEHCYFDNTDGKVTLHAIADGVTVGVHLVLSDCNSERSKFLVLERKTDLTWTGAICFSIHF